MARAAVLNAPARSRPYQSAPCPARGGLIDCRSTLHKENSTMKHLPVPSYTGKWLLITGGAKRVGADIVRYMAARDLNIFLHYRKSRDAAEGLKKEVEEAYGVRVELVTGDLSKEEDVEKLFDAISPDIVINNAGAFEIDDFAKNIDANAKAVYLVTSKAVDRMLRDKKGGVVFLVGDAFIESGGVYPANVVGYTMSKAYIPYVVRQLAAAHGKAGLRFLGILNGPIEPPKDAPVETVSAIRAEINLPERELNPWIGGAKVGEAIYGLLLATAINGESVRVDGGRVSQGRPEH